MSVIVHEPPGASPGPAVVANPPVTARVAGVVVALERACTACRGGGYVPVVLEERCRSCQGSGYEDLDTEQPCPICEGRCVVPVEAMEECGRCRGRGVELTPEGRRLLVEAGADLWRFLRRWRRS